MSQTPEQEIFKVTANKSFLDKSKLKREFKVLFNKPRLDSKGAVIENFIVAEFTDLHKAAEVYHELGMEKVPRMRNWIG